MTEIRLTQTFDAPQRTVYTALTNEVMLNNWLSDDASVTARVNGFYHLYRSEGVITAGIYRAVERDTRLAFSWFTTGDAAETAVDITLAPAGDGTTLTLVHSGFPSNEAANAALSRWDAAFENLRYYLVNGLDRRMMLRPMLGILPGSLDDARRESHNLQHVQDGVFLTNVVPGGGAEQSGLKANDVIVELEDQPIKNFFDMSAIIAWHQAGDTIPAVVWRGQDKLNVDITFGQRPRPELAQTKDELVAQVTGIVADVKRELDDILRDVPESVYSFKPSAAEWSLKEQLAHLIVAERANSYYDWLVVNGNSSYPFAENDEMQLAFGAYGYDSGAALLEGVKRTLDENVAVAAALPQAVIDNRPLFLTMANIIAFTGSHVRTHYEQMQRTIESARAALGIAA